MVIVKTSALCDENQRFVMEGFYGASYSDFDGYSYKSHKALIRPVFYMIYIERYATIELRCFTADAFGYESPLQYGCIIL